MYIKLILILTWCETENSNHPKFYKLILGAGEMAQRLRALAALVEDLGSVLNIHISAHNYL